MRAAAQAKEVEAAVVGGSTNLPALGPDFKVPFFVIQGRDDWITPSELVVDYMKSVRAPAKRLTSIDGAGHFVAMTHTGSFVAALREDLALARRAGLKTIGLLKTTSSARLATSRRSHGCRCRRPMPMPWNRCRSGDRSRRR